MLGRPCDLWARADDYSRVKVYVDREFNGAAGGVRGWGRAGALSTSTHRARPHLPPVPLSVTDEYNDDGAWVPVMTWAFESLRLEAVPPAAFNLPHPWTHAACKRHLSGWPSLHVFHHYLRV